MILYFWFNIFILYFFSMVSPEVDGVSFSLMGLAVPIGMYLFYAYCQYTLSEKLKAEKSILAWFPILSLFNLMKIVGLSYWWILGLFIPLLNIYVIIKISHAISVRTGHGAGWTVGLVMLGAIFFPITALTYEPTVTPTAV